VSRRVANLLFSGELVMSICQLPVGTRRRWVEITENALPRDSKVVARFIDEKTGMFGITIESETLREIPDGSPIPFLEKPHFRVEYK